MVRTLLPMIGLLILLCVSGCRSSGQIVYEGSRPLSIRAADGTVTQALQEFRVEIQTPQHPTNPGSIQIHPDGTVSASTGSEPTVSAASKSLGKLPWLGGLLLVGGVLGILLKAKVPLIPLELGLGLAISGLLLMVLPSLIEAYLNYILLGLVAAAVVATIWRVNRLQR
jgi:hypothetical protein